LWHDWLLVQAGSCELADSATGELKTGNVAADDVGRWEAAKKS
jgi:hypothetical protein